MATYVIRYKARKSVRKFVFFEAEETSVETARVEVRYVHKSESVMVEFCKHAAFMNAVERGLVFEELRGVNVEHTKWEGYF